MKQLSSQKWILSTLLFAALGSQYYFSTNSKNSGFVEMSQLADTQEQSVADIAAALDRSRGGSPTPAAAAVQSSGDRTTRARTEGADPKAPCNDCYVLSKAEGDRLRLLLEKVINEKKAAAAASKDTTVAETAAEKMKREREERAEKRREDKLAKDEKKRDAEIAKADKKKEEQELRDEKFKDDFERMSARCNDVECNASSFASALNRYSDKSKMVSSKVVNEIYAEHIAKDLRTGLKDSNNTAAHAAVESLMADLPITYRSLKTKTIDIAREVTAPKAVEANTSFKLAETYRKANKLTESNAAFARATEEKAELERMLKAQYTAIHDGTERVEDKTTYTYYNVNYAKPASQWLADIMTNGTFSTGVTDATAVAVNPLATSRGVVRGGVGTTTTTTTVIGNPINNNIGVGTQNGFRGGRIGN